VHVNHISLSNCEAKKFNVLSEFILNLINFYKCLLPKIIRFALLRRTKA
jgi:hypothetical protein